MSQVKKTKKIFVPIVILSVLFLSIGIVFIFYPPDKIKDIQALSQKTYDSAFISMYPIDSFSSDSFLKYRGLNTYVTSHTARTISELNFYMNLIFASENTINTVYIGLCPPNAEDDVAMAKALEDILSYITAYPTVTFEILLPSPSMEEWISYKDEDIVSILNTYKYVTFCMAPHTNVLCFFPGGEEWLIKNTSNYAENCGFNSIISEKILCTAFCDRSHQINASNSEQILNNLLQMIIMEKTTPSVFPDCSDKSIVFFGDSIFGNQNGSYSVPGVIHNFTNARVYNYAVGGTSAIDIEADTAEDNSFSDILDAFLSQKAFPTRDNTFFPYDAFDSESSNLLFVINYGYNDYLFCASTDEYYVALTTEIERLKTAYPNAAFLLISPYQCIYSGSGVADPNESNLFVSDYAKEAAQVAVEQNISYLDIDSVLNLTMENHQDYFSDKCHYNEYGRFWLGQTILSVLANES